MALPPFLELIPYTCIELVDIADPIESGLRYIVESYLNLVSTHGRHNIAETRANIYTKL